MDNLLLFNQIISLPENLQAEILDFIESLKQNPTKEKKQKHPKFGSGKGLFKMSEDFDAPLEDFKDYM